MGEHKSEKIITSLMLAFAMTRAEAQIFLGQHEQRILSDVIDEIQRRMPPRYLDGWFRRRRRAAWMDGLHEGINILFSRNLRTHYIEKRKREAVPV